MATLVYPMGGDGGDFVAFGHSKYSMNRDGGNRNSAPPPMGNAIRLYMPTTTPSISNDNGWGPITSPPGAVGQILQDAARTVGSENVGAGAANAVETLINGLGNTAGAAHQLGVNYLSEKLGVSPNNATQLGQGKIFNPNIELMYDGPRNRSFAMQFDFIPKTPLEAQMVQQIIMEFKKWSAPEETDSGMFKVPHVWEVKYMTSGKQNCSRTKSDYTTKLRL